MTPAAAAHPFRLAPPLPNRALVLGVVAAATLAGFAAFAWQPAAHAPDTELVQLIRAMAVLKLAIVAGAAWLVDWRLRQPVGPVAASAYLVALASMALGPGLVWGLAHIVAGAALLHAGLALLIALAWKDEGLRLPFRMSGRAPVTVTVPGTPASASR